MQTTDKPYLQTVDASIASGVRETYDFGNDSIIPFQRMAYSNSGGALDTQGYVLGIFLMKVHYTFRGRRSVPLDVSI